MSTTAGWNPDRRESHPHRVVVCPHRSVLVDHGSWCGDDVLCASLLSYGDRRRAANAHARLRKLEEPARIELASWKSGNPRSFGPVHGQGNGEDVSPCSTD
jgi:hypothetical protein